MKRQWIIALLLVAEAARGASCCVGGSPKTFINLRRLQTYELGISTSIRDEYARYDLYGDRTDKDSAQTYSLSLGGGARLSETVQVYGVFPVVYQVNRYGNRTGTDAFTGDMTIGTSWTVLEHLFFDDWYPTIALTTGLKLPTGRQDYFEAGKHIPGTGNGLWEPFVGASIRKDFEWVTLSFSANYTRPIGTQNNGIQEGNRWELSESLIIPLNRRFSLGGGAAQMWTADKSQNGGLLANSDERALSGFLTTTYFVTPLVDVTGTVDFTLPSERLNVNHAAFRGFTFTMKYGFY